MRFTPSQKLEIIRKYLLLGTSVYSLCREYKISKVTFYKWFALYRRSRKNQIDALSSRIRSGTAHPRSLTYKQKFSILRLVHKHPEYSSHKLARVLGLGNFGVQTFLYKDGLNRYENRLTFSGRPFWKRESPQRREAAIRLLEKGWTVFDICKHFNISKQTFFKWKRRWDAAKGEERSLALADRWVSGPEHHKYLDVGKKQQIIELVKANPELSVHKIHRQLAGVVGHYTVQNVLAREDLNTYEKRKLFAKRLAIENIEEATVEAPVIPIWRLRWLIAPFLTIPKLAWLFTRGQIFLLLILFLGFYFYKLVAAIVASSTGSHVGIFFASISLTFGLLFFIYSLKYYLATFLVLRLAQGGSKDRGGERELERIEEMEDERSRFSRMVAKILNLGGFARAGEVRESHLNVNLEKVKLSDTKLPFVSIHVAVFNEKRVVERLIQACTSQEWYVDSSKLKVESGKFEGQESEGGRANYEVIIADDSTDETTEIAKQVLLGGGWSIYSSSDPSPNGEGESRSLEVESSRLAPLGGASSNNNDLEVFTFTKADGPTVKLIHRFSRSGFKGGALQRALEETDPRASYITVFDADFVPYPDTIEQFVKTFQVLGASKVTNESKESNGQETSDSPDPSVTSDSSKIAAVQGYQSSFAKASEGQGGMAGSKIAAVQGYQWHVLNKSENWVTRGVRTEYAGSYVIERSGEEIYGGLKQIAGSVYMIRADILRAFGWGTSITEDFELTLRLYESGFKVAFTPYIQAPAEAVSTLKRLIRQRMRWAEGASFNVKVMLGRMLWGRWEEEASAGPAIEVQSSKFKVQSLESPASAVTRRWIPSRLSRAEKLEFAYLAPYYLQAAFFVIGTFSWFLSEAVLGSRLPFWTAALGWSLVFTNLLSLPLMNIIGMFLEESDERDYIGILSFIALSYIVVPFQAYAAIKGFLEHEEGPWFRTPKTGMITDTFGRAGFSKFFGNILGRPAAVHANDIRMESARMNANISINSHRLAFNPLRADYFRVRPRYFRYAGNLALGVVISLTVLMSMFAPFMPTATSYASQTQLKTIESQSQSQSFDDAQDDLLESERSRSRRPESNRMGQSEESKSQSMEQKPKDESTSGQFNPKDPPNKPSLRSSPGEPDAGLKEEILRNATAEEITKSRVIQMGTKDSKKVEFIFKREPIVRIKLDYREIEFETKKVFGQTPSPKAAKIFGDKQVVYEEIIEGVDLKYTIANDLLVEEFIIKQPSVAKAMEGKIEQTVKTVDVKVVWADDEAFGFYSEDGRELFKFGAPFAKDAKGEKTVDLGMSLEKAYIGHTLTKTIGGSAKDWLLNPERIYPVSIDPSVIVSGGFTEAEGSYGGLQRKVAFVNSRWWSVHADGGIVRYQDSGNGVDWDAAVTISSDSADTDNWNPSIAVSNNFIHVFWVDDGDNEVHARRLNTTGEALGTECLTLTSSANISSTYMVSVAQLGDTSAMVAFSDTTGGTAGVDVYEVTGLDGTCAMTDVHPGNITFGTQGAGLTDGDRPVLVGLTSTTAAMVFQDGTDLSFALFDSGKDEWTSNNQQLANVTHTMYSVTTDGTNIWALVVDTTQNDDVLLYSYPAASTGVVETSTAIDADIGGAAADTGDSFIDMDCISATDCKIVYTDTLDGTSVLMFVDCDNADCSTNTATNIDSSVGGGDEGGDPRITCPATDNCKIVYGDMNVGAPDAVFVDCGDATCSGTAGTCTSGARTCAVVDTDIGAADTEFNGDVFCPTDVSSNTDCKFIFFNSAEETNDAIWFADCSDASCGTRDALTSIIANINDDETNNETKMALWCNASADCHFTFHDAVNGDLSFIDCTADSDCSTNSGAIDIDADVGANVSSSQSVAVANALDCSAGGTDCKIVYADGSQNEVNFVDCNDATCSAPTITKIDDTAGGIMSHDASLYCVAADDCKGTFVGDTTGGAEDVYMFDCDAVACTAGSATELGDPPFMSVIDCVGGTGDCKLAYYDIFVSTTDVPVKFADCTNAKCLPDWTDADDPWTGQTAVETASITYDSSNSDLYAHVIMETTDKAYWKSTDVSTILWGGQNDYGWTSGTLNQISAPEKGAGTTAIGAVLHESTNSNFEFAVVPESTIILLLVVPFWPKLLGKIKKKQWL